MARDPSPSPVPQDSASQPARADGPTAPVGLVCGLVMPLAMTDNCAPAHWAEVRSIIQEAVESIEEYDFHCDMVSNANESAVIQTSIVQNLNSNDIVVCDVSGKNPNVMFELGMRVAFDMPVVVIKDDKTDFSFDTSPIAHLIYPRDLRYGLMQTFKSALAAKVAATYKKHIEGGSGSSYLASFGPIKVAHLQTQEVSLGELVVGRLNDIQEQLNLVVATNRRQQSSASDKEKHDTLWQVIWNSDQIQPGSKELGPLERKVLRMQLRQALGPNPRNTPVARKKAEHIISEAFPSMGDQMVRERAKMLLEDLDGLDE